MGAEGGVDITVASGADFAEMHRVRMSVRENRLADPGRIGPADYEAILAGGGLAWLAWIEGRVVGFAAADLPRRNIWALFVDPAYEGRGVGRRLHDVMVDWLFEQGPEAIWLGTDPGTRAEAFYRAAGWQPAGSLANGEIRLTLSAHERARRRERAQPAEPERP